MVDPLQAANAPEYFTLFFRIVVSVEPTGGSFCDVNWEEKRSVS